MVHAHHTPVAHRTVVRARRAVGRALAAKVLVALTLVGLLRLEDGRFGLLEFDALVLGAGLLFHGVRWRHHRRSARHVAFHHDLRRLLLTIEQEAARLHDFWRLFHATTSALAL